MARAMKDSGIEWIGVIPETWRVVRGKTVFRQRNEKGNDVCLQLLSPTQKYGVIPQTEYEQLSGMKAVKLDIAADYSQLKTIHEGDFCISLRSFQGGFEYSQHEGVVSPAYQVFYPHIDCNDGYFKYLFKDRTFIDKMNSYTLSLRDGKNIAFSDFANTYIPFPPIDEQTRIAAFLDTECARIDAVIEQTRASIEEYKKLKQSVITQAVTKGIRPGRKMKDSGVEWIGEIPEEWNRLTAHRIITSTQNGLTRRDLEESSGQIVLKLKNISSSGVIDYAHINRINLTEEEIERYALERGDFLFVRVNGSKALVGKCAIFTGKDETIAYNDHIIRVRLNSLIEKEYFHWYLLSNVGRIEIDLRTSTAAGQFTISGEGLRDISILLPPVEEQKQIVEYLDRYVEDINTLMGQKEAVITQLESYKKSLIYEYVTGKKEA